MLPSSPPPTRLLPERHATLYAALAACGWERRPGALVAPNGTFWLPLAPTDLTSLRNHVAARRDRVYRQRRAFLSHADFRASYDDLDTLLGVLEQLSEDGGLDRFFGPLSRPLEQLAERRGLALVRYEGGEPVWRLRGPHPCTGRVTVFVRKAGRDTAHVSARWSFGCQSTGERLERRLVSGPLTRDGELVAAFVGQALDELQDLTPELAA